jgi:hypothetical protein
MIMIYERQLLGIMQVRRKKGIGSLSIFNFYSQTVDPKLGGDVEVTQQDDQA